LGQIKRKKKKGLICCKVLEGGGGVWQFDGKVMGLF